VELRRLESDRLLHLGRTEAALFELKRVMGMAPAAPLALRETLEEMVQRQAEEATHGLAIRSGELAQRPDVREAEARVGIAAANLDRSLAEGRFDVSLFGSYTRMDAGFPQLGLSPAGSLERVRGVFHYVSVGATVTVPLLNRNQGTVAAARAARESAAATFDAARLAGETETAAARTLDEYAHQAVKLYSSGTQALARQNLTVVGQSYELGRVTVYDVLAELRRYLDVERAYTDALRAAFEARTELKRALGELR
jgi:outer membrane protein TolC